MSGQTLYTELGSDAEPTADRGRTEQTAAKETVDNDRAPMTLYAVIGGYAGHGLDRGRTEGTKAGGETVDRDRQLPTGFSALVGSDPDLYAALSAAAAAGGDRGRTEITEATETLDWDRPPVGPRT